VKKLGEMGHRVEMASGASTFIDNEAFAREADQKPKHIRNYAGHARGMFGRGQIIQRTVDKVTGRLVWAAGSDPRGDGHASAQI
jgi:gamma-glutamyltranspeptidase